MKKMLFIFFHLGCLLGLIHKVKEIKAQHDRSEVNSAACAFIEMGE